MSEQFGWVIEAGWTTAPDLEYWAGCVPTGGGGIQHDWRKDHAKAVRFAREVDAKKIARTLIDGELTASRIASLSTLGLNQQQGRDSK